MRKITLLCLLFIACLGWQGHAQVSIGEQDGTTSSIPIRGCYNYSYTQQLVYQSEVNATGEITSITFTYSSGSFNNSTGWTIYLGHTDKTEFASTSDWVPSTDLTQVYSGAVTFPAGGGQMEIIFDTPFSYNNSDNLVIAIDENQGGFNCSPNFGKTSDLGVTRGIVFYSDSTNPDPTAPPTSGSYFTSTSYINNMILGGIQQACPTPNGLMATNTSLNTATINWNANDPVPSNGYEYAVTTSSTPPSSGTNTMDTSVTDVSVTQSTENYLYVRANCDGEEKSAWSSYMFMGPTPGQIGTVEYSAALLPINSCYGYSYSQQLYFANELNASNDGAGTFISKIRFYYDGGVTSFSSSNIWTIYMGNTSKTTFAGTTDWVPVSEMSEVFSGTVTLPTTGNWMEIVLDTGFLWDGSSSLVIGVDENTSSYDCSAAFGVFDDQNSVGRSLLYYSDSVNPDPANPVTASYFYASANTIQFEMTLPPSCLKPTNIATSEITTTTADISWIAGDSETEWNVSWGLAGYTPGDTDEKGTANTTENLYEIATGLMANTAYDVYVQAVCGASDMSDWAGPASFRTLCEAVSTLPYTEDFESYATSTFPDCWMRPVAYSGYPSVVSYELSQRLKFQSLEGTPTYAVTPAFAEDIHNLRVSFILEREGTSSGTIDVGVMSDPTDPSTFELVQTIDPSNTDDFLEYSFNLNLTTLSGANNHIAFRHNSDSSYWYYWLDDVTVEILPSCLEPIDLTVTNITTNSADLSWTAGNTETAWNVEILSAGETPTGIPTESGVTNPYTASLDPGTDYDVYVQADCTGGDLSEWAGPISFTTDCVTYDLPVCENFDTAPVGAYNNPTVPNCWSSTDPGAGYSYVTSSGTFYLYNAGDNSGAYLLISPEIPEVSNGNNWIHFDADGSNNYSLIVGSMSDPTDATTFTAIETVTLTSSVSEYHSVLIPESTDSYIAIKHGLGGTYRTITIDNICIEEVPSCFVPTGLTQTGATETSVDLEWTEMGAATEWDIEYGEVGFTLGEGTMITDIEGTPQTSISGLTATSTYDYYVRANCSGGDSDWSSVNTFSTLPENDNLANAIALTLNAGCTGNMYSNVGATAETGETKPSCFYQNPDNSVWFSFVAPESGNVHISTDYLPMDLNDSQIALYAAPTDVNDLTTLAAAIACDQDSGNVGSSWMSVIDIFGLVAGDTYYIQVDGYGTNKTGGFCITVDTLDDFVYMGGSWMPQDPAGVATSTDNVSVMNGSTNFTADIEMNNLTVETGATLNVRQAMTVNGDIVNDGNITFRSNSTELGQVANMTGVNISGEGSMTVERYIPVRDDGKGAYRYITSAVNSTGTIHANWQEAAASAMANPNSGYGMYITGAGGFANGFDTTPANAPSMFTYDNSVQTYVGVTNTNVNTLIAGQAYSAYVWGDRSVDILTSNDPTATSTTLRATGELVAGDHAVSGLSTTAGGFNLVGNPYQAILDMNSVLASSTNLNTGVYYVWDPNLGTRGAYATVDLSGATTTPSASAANQYMMPGQAVWVVTAASGAASLTFQESDKAVTADMTDVFKGANDLASIELQLFQADRFANGQSLSDAVRINFSGNGDNSVLSNDAPKLSNLDENLARTNGENLLSVENRAMPINGEVLPLNNEQYRVADYVFNAIVGNLPSGTTAYLVDNYLNSKTELVNDQATVVAFSVTASNLESIAPDRFSIVFERNGLGVDENSLSGLSIYPNPVKNGQFFIAAAGLSGEKVQVNLYNILGQKVYVSSETVNSDSRVNVPTTSLEAGVYLVEMKHNGKVITGKVVVQ